VLPGPCWHLLVARNVLDPTEMKVLFVSNAPHGGIGGNDPLGGLLAMARRAVASKTTKASRSGPLRGATLSGSPTPLILSAISYLFLAKINQRLRGKKIRVDGVPSPHRGLGADSLVVDGRPRVGAAVGAHRPTHRAGPAHRQRLLPVAATPSGTRRLLRSMGIKVTQTPVCKWDSVSAVVLKGADDLISQAQAFTLGRRRKKNFFCVGPFRGQWFGP